MNTKEITCLDFNAPEHGVDITIQADGKKVWVNVDGICRLRITAIQHLEMHDDRPLFGNDDA